MKDLQRGAIPRLIRYFGGFPLNFDVHLNENLGRYVQVNHKDSMTIIVYYLFPL